MTIKISDSRPATSLSAGMLVDGHAYKDLSDGRIFVANRFRDLIAFSLDGRCVINSDDAPAEFVEIDLEVIEHPVGTLCLDD